MDSEFVGRFMLICSTHFSGQGNTLILHEGYFSIWGSCVSWGRATAEGSRGYFCGLWGTQVKTTKSRVGWSVRSLWTTDSQTTHYEGGGLLLYTGFVAPKMNNFIKIKLEKNSLVPSFCDLFLEQSAWKSAFFVQILLNLFHPLRTIDSPTNLFISLI